MNLHQWYDMKSQSLLKLSVIIKIQQALQNSLYCTVTELYKVFSAAQPVTHTSQSLQWWHFVTEWNSILVFIVWWYSTVPPLYIYYFLVSTVTISQETMINVLVSWPRSNWWTMMMTTTCNSLLTCGSRCRRASPQSVPTARATRNCNSCW